MRKLLLVISGLGTLLFGSVFFVDYSQQMYHVLIVFFKAIFFLSFFVTFSHLIIGAVKGYFTARFFVLGYSLLFFSAMLHVLHTFGLIDYSYFSYLWEYGVLLEIGSFTFGFAYEYYKTNKNRVELLEEIASQKSEYLEKHFQSQEKERRRIAESLHNGILQQLVSLRFKMHNVPEEAKTELLNSLDKITAELRDISHEMMPKSLIKLGLKEAIDDLLITSLSSINIKYEYDYFLNKVVLSQTLELMLYRICQELIQNILKHSLATKISINLYEFHNEIHLVVEDNGVGFDTENMVKGIGLESIKARVESMQGTLHIQSDSGQGTTIQIKIPNV